MIMKLKRIGPDDFKKSLESLLSNENISNILIRGYFDNSKLNLTLRAIKDNKEMREGVFVIGGMKQGRTENVLGHALHIPNFYLDSLEKVDIGNQTQITSDKWNQDVEFTYGDNCDFALFYPIQLEVADKKFVTTLIQKIKNSKAKKNIILTTNDWTKNPETLYKYMDSVISLDLEDYSEEYREKLKYIKINIDGKPLPY